MRGKPQQTENVDLGLSENRENPETYPKVLLIIIPFLNG